MTETSVHKKINNETSDTVFVLKQMLYFLSKRERERGEEGREERREREKKELDREKGEGEKGKR